MAGGVFSSGRPVRQASISSAFISLFPYNFSGLMRPVLASRSSSLAPPNGTPRGRGGVLPAATPVLREVLPAAVSSGLVGEESKLLRMRLNIVALFPCYGLV